MSNCQGVEAYLDYLIPAYYLPLISPYVSSYIVYLMYSILLLTYHITYSSPIGVSSVPSSGLE